MTYVFLNAVGFYLCPMYVVVPVKCLILCLLKDTAGAIKVATTWHLFSSFPFTIFTHLFFGHRLQSSSTTILIPLSTNHALRSHGQCEYQHHQLWTCFFFWCLSKGHCVYDPTISRPAMFLYRLVCVNIFISFFPPKVLICV